MNAKKWINWIGRNLLEMNARFMSPFDFRFLREDVPPSRLTSHSSHLDHLGTLFNKEGMRILEIGSREVVGASTARKVFSKAEYVGFDYYPGPNVDVVGDAHRIASLVDGPFDLIYSTAVYEHIAMPWIVSLEIAKLLKVGGMVMIETHFSYLSHERPWNFFQFSDMGLRVLFPPALGFECIEAGMCNPMIGRFSRYADPHLRYKSIPGLYCHSAFLARKTHEAPRFDWGDMTLAHVVGATSYPEPKAD